MTEFPTKTERIRPTYSIGVTVEQEKRIRAAAERHGQKIATFIRTILIEWLDNNDC